MASGYQVGNIFVNLESSSKDTINALNETISVLNKVKNSLNSIQNINVSQVQKNLEGIGKINLNNISNAFSPLQKFDSKNLSSVTRLLNSLTKLNFNNVNFKQLETDFNKMTTIIDPFVSKIQRAEPSLRAFSNALDMSKVNSQMAITQARVNAINSKAKKKEVLDNIKIKKANAQLKITEQRLKNVNSKAISVKKSFNTIFNLGKIYLILNYLKRLGTAIGNMASEAINFNETLNKFQVAMGEYYPQALDFVNELTKAFNLSTESIMNYQSTFMNMLSALGGLSNDVSYQLSETLTRMAIDYASLFNVSIETAMQQFQSGLSGQVKDFAWLVRNYKAITFLNAGNPKQVML